MKWQVTAVISSLLIIAACDRNPTPPPVTSPTEPAPAVQPTALSRAEIVAALALAASAHAAGAAPSEAATIAGRPFAIRLPFGCFGSAEPGNRRALEVAGDGLASWSFSDDRTSQTLRLTPIDWTRSPLLLEAGTEPAWEHVDGYWIARPWLEADACPVAPPPPSPSPTAAPDAEAAETVEAAPDGPQTVEPVITAGLAVPASPPFTAGLASIRAEGGSRLGRQPGEAYSFVVRAPEGGALSAPENGYRVVLQGRISTFPDGHAVRCSTESPNRRPVCVAAVVLDSVAFETATGERLSEWRPEG